jgi:hypothetical protein
MKVAKIEFFKSDKFPLKTRTLLIGYGQAEVSMNLGGNPE